MCCRRNKASACCFSRRQFFFSLWPLAVRESKRPTEEREQKKIVFSVFLSGPVSNESVVWTSCGHINNNSHSFWFVCTFGFYDCIVSEWKSFNLDKTENNTFTAIFPHKCSINMLKMRFGSTMCNVCVCVWFLFSFSGLLYSQAFEWVNIDVNYLVSKQICCMQSHGHCNWIANKIKLLFDDIVKVAYTQNRLYDLQRFSGTKEIKKNVGLHFVPSCPIEMDCNKHATNVDNLTVWKHSKPFSNALSPPSPRNTHHSANNWTDRCRGKRKERQRQRIELQCSRRLSLFKELCMFK